MTEYEFTVLLDGDGGHVEAESEREAKRKALEQTKERMEELVERDQQTKHSSGCQHYVRDLRPRRGSVELHEVQ